MIETYLARYGYLAIGAGTFLEGEAVLLAGGALAQRGTLSLVPVIAAAFVGALCGDQLWFRVGRKIGPRVLAKRPRWQLAHSRAQVWLNRYGDYFVVGFRFVTGIRTATPFFLGTTSYSAPRFLALNVFGAALWATAIGCAGWGVGAGFASALERVGRFGELALGALALAFVLFLLVRRWRKRRSPKLTL
jgi:membrane protein DedA with SNARE-associated domain